MFKLYEMSYCDQTISLFPFNALNYVKKVNYFQKITRWLCSRGENELPLNKSVTFTKRNIRP